MELALSPLTQKQDKTDNVPQQVYHELRVVFDLCDTDGSGKIELSELANLSRSHVDGTTQVEQILEIFGCGSEESGVTGGRLTFDQFATRIVSFMQEGGAAEADTVRITNQKNLNLRRRSSNSHPEDNGVFNENLKRAFEKDTPAVTSSPVDSTKIRKRSSQTRLSGNIPLVNTSSEDEGEAEDSFDRKIASSLALARPLDLPQQFLARGSLQRRTIRKQSSGSLGSHSPGSANKLRGEAAIRMSPIIDGSSSTTSPMSRSSGSDGSGRESPATADTRLALQDLQKKVGQLVDTAAQPRAVSPPCNKADLDEEFQNSIHLARKHGDERLEVERQRHRDMMESKEREMNLERKNFQLRFEQFQEEQKHLQNEVEALKEKVRLINIEKAQLEEQKFEQDEVFYKQSITVGIQVDEKKEEDQKRRDREEELVNTVKKLTERMETQDTKLAEVKEDNFVLRKQITSLKESLKKGNNASKLRIFNLGKENTVPSENFDDPKDLRAKLKSTEKKLNDQYEANKQLKMYMGEMLANVMESNPQILEKQ